MKRGDRYDTADLEEAHFDLQDFVLVDFLVRRRSVARMRTPSTAVEEMTDRRSMACRRLGSLRYGLVLINGFFGMSRL